MSCFCRLKKSDVFASTFLFRRGLRKIASLFSCLINSFYDAARFLPGFGFLDSLDYRIFYLRKRFGSCVLFFIEADDVVAKGGFDRFADLTRL